MKKQIVKALFGVAVCMSSQMVVAQTKPFTHSGVQVGKSFETCPLMRMENCTTVKVLSFKKLSSAYNYTTVEINLKSPKNKKPYKVVIQCSIFNPMVSIDNNEFQKVPLSEQGASAVMTAPVEVYLKACHNTTYEHYNRIVKKYGYSSYDW